MDEYTLPTEPGYYLDKEDDLWRLTGPGEWVFPEENELSDKHERYAPFTRLMTESQWEAERERLELPEIPPYTTYSRNYAYLQGWNDAGAYLSGHPKGADDE